MSGDGDLIFITGLAIHAYHGVMEHEGTVGQTFLLDLELGIDLAEASRSDRIASTVSYNEVVDCVSRAFCADRFRLVEAAAGAVAEAILAHYPRITRVRVTVHKPHAPVPATFTDVGVSIFRERHG
jgi:dihydroneopterin aldolase